MLISCSAFRWPIFPLSGAPTPWGRIAGWSLAFVDDVIRHGALPALSIILVSLGWWFLSMRSLIISEQGQDYILWAEAKGLPRRRIFWAYAFRNALLPQTTGLALSFGNIVSGALITEVIFAYPGLGYLIYNAIKETRLPGHPGQRPPPVVSRGPRQLRHRHGLPADRPAHPRRRGS